MNKKRSFPRLVWGLLLLFSFLFVVPPAMADRTASMTVAQTFGDGSSDYHKIMVKTQSGNRYFVWYYYLLGVNVGSTVVITFDDYNNWNTITNTVNGAERNIDKVLKVN